MGRASVCISGGAPLSVHPSLASRDRCVPCLMKGSGRRSCCMPHATRPPSSAHSNRPTKTQYSAAPARATATLALTSSPWTCVNLRDEDAGEKLAELHLDHEYDVQ